MDYDVAIIGAGIAGLATAARLQAAGLSTVVIEAHSYPGGCAGFFRRQGFSFDVGATTLVDFEGEGLGAQLLRQIGLPLEGLEPLPGYTAWLPDRTVILHRDSVLWVRERQAAFGNGPDIAAFWALLDRLATVFWSASRQGIRLPFRNLADRLHAGRTVPLIDWPLTRYLTWTMGDALRHYRLRDHRPLAGLLSMLVEDTVHATLDQAPLINAALGITIRGAGLSRCRGGMYGFWKRFIRHYRALAGRLLLNRAVTAVEREPGARKLGFLVHTTAGPVRARQVVCTLPLALTHRIAGRLLGNRLLPHLERNRSCEGGAVAVFLGVPCDEVDGQTHTHHQLLQSYGDPLGNGNNMFLSVSSPDDTESAPPGYRTVMISTHCALEEWEDLTEPEYLRRKQAIGARLIDYARRVYPHLGRNPAVVAVATPRTYQTYTNRPRGAVGGFRLHLGNSNLRATPHDVGVEGFWLAGDNTWPGLGTVACVLGSRLVSDRVLAERRERTHGPFAMDESQLCSRPSLQNLLR